MQRGLTPSVWNRSALTGEGNQHVPTHAGEPELATPQREPQSLTASCLPSKRGTICCTGRHAIALCCCMIGTVTGMAGASLALLTPLPDTQSAGVVLPPFTSTETMRRIAATGLPIADIRLGGRLVIVMIDADGVALAALRAQGLIVIAAEGPPTCTWTAKDT